MADFILLVLPWVGSLLLLIMIVRWPVEAMLTLLGSTAASTCGVVAVVARARGRGGPRPGAGGGPISVPEHPYQLIIPSSDPSDRGARLMR